jgi:hypothetical protein
MDVERLREIAEKTVEYAVKQKVNQAQAVAFMVDNALTRFANSQIHQNVAQKMGGVSIKVVLDQRISTVQANTLEEKGHKRGCGASRKNCQGFIAPTKNSKAFQNQKLGNPLREPLTRRQLSVRQSLGLKGLGKP